MVKFKYYNSGSTFNSNALSNDDIAFVEDTGSIWTHGIEFGAGGSSGIPISTSNTGTVASSSSANSTQFYGTVDGITQLYDGLTILYKVPDIGATSSSYFYGCTLNINNLGEHPIQKPRLTSSIVTSSVNFYEFKTNSIVQLTYNTSVSASVYSNGTSTTVSGCWITSNSDTDTNTTYTTGTLNELNTGTATSTRVWSPSVLASYVTSKVPTTMKASGSSHAGGLVPDPGATQGTTKYLREDGTWNVPSSSITYGTTAGTACEGNDSRLSDARVASNVIARYVQYSVTQSTAVATSLTVDGCENVVYNNTGSADIILPIATSQSGVTVVITDENTSLTIPPNGYAEVNFLRVTTNNTTRVFVRSIVSE